MSDGVWMRRYLGFFVVVLIVGGHSNADPKQAVYWQTLNRQAEHLAGSQAGNEEVIRTIGAVGVKAPPNPRRPRTQSGAGFLLRQRTATYRAS